MQFLIITKTPYQLQCHWASRPRTGETLHSSVGLCHNEEQSPVLQSKILIPSGDHCVVSEMSLVRTHIRVLEEPTEVLRMEWLEAWVRRKGLPVGGAVLRWEEVSCVSVDGVGVGSVLPSPASV